MRVLVPMQRFVLGPVRTVVLGRPVERRQQVLAPAHDQGPDVVGLEEPLVRVDRDAVGPLQPRHPVRVALGQARGPSVGGVDVEPQRLALGDRSARPGRRRPSRCWWSRRRRRSRAASAPPRGPRRWRRPPARRATGTARPTATTRSVPSGKPSTSRARPIEKWVWSLAYTRTPSRSAPRGAPGVPRSFGEPHVARHGHRHDVGHHPAAGQHAPAVLAEPDEVAEPPGDLFLDERADRSGVPDVDPWWIHCDSTSPAIDIGSGGGVK